MKKRLLLLVFSDDSISPKVKKANIRQWPPPHGQYILHVYVLYIQNVNKVECYNPKIISSQYPRG